MSILQLWVMLLLLPIWLGVQEPLRLAGERHAAAFRNWRARRRALGIVRAVTVNGHSLSLVIDGRPIDIKSVSYTGMDRKTVNAVTSPVRLGTYEPHGRQE